MSLRELQKRVEEELADLPIPAPFTIDALVANMEEARGRTLLLKEVPEQLVRPGTACGLRISTAEFSIILYRRRPTEYQTDHVILHELCHEWLDHGTTLSPQELQVLLPVLDTTLIERVGQGEVTIQARANYEQEEEKFAELGASLIPRMARAVSSDDMLGRLGDTLSRPTGGHRARPHRFNPFRRT
ncbi:toxin [Streptomyces javensis]|uniref:Toxin n=1 Tax=Streptomyces javensis TaxID=114698 RepID=A0ABS0R6Z3_9ACTN|nr:toxin [Streptomyces javensis]MBI0313050.1 toxin [Streptomyces javensis]